VDDVTVYYTASLEVYPRVYQATYHALDRQKDRYVNHVDVTDTRDQSQEYNWAKDTANFDAIAPDSPEDRRLAAVNTSPR